MNECNCEQAIKLKKENINLNTSRTMRGVQIGELQEEIEQLTAEHRKLENGYLKIEHEYIQENKQLKISVKELENENLKLKTENIFCDKTTIKQLRLLINRKNNEKDRLYLRIFELMNEITKVNKGMGRKNRKIARLKLTICKVKYNLEEDLGCAREDIARLKQTLADWNIVTNEGEL